MSCSAIAVRRATPDDAGALLAYLAALRAETLDTISNDTNPTLEQERAWIESTNASDSSSGAILVAVAEGNAIGMLDIRRSERVARRHTISFGMSVAKPFRRQGIGEQLLRAAIAEAKAWSGVCRVELEVVPWNTAAIALYEKLGFKLEARKIKAINFRGGPEDMLLMALTW